MARNESSRMIVDALVAVCVTLALMLPLAGSVATTYGYWELAAARESVSWPSTVGVVESAHAVSSSTSSSSRRNRSSSNSSSATLELRYRYTVDGTGYTGFREAFGRNPTWPDLITAHQDIRARYPPGGEVEVYYRPTSPGTSVLYPGSGETGGLVTFGLVAGGIGVLLWVPLGIRALVRRSGR